MSRPSVFASALLLNSTSAGGLAAVTSVASSIACTRPYLPQLADCTCAFTLQHENCLHGGQVEAHSVLQLQSTGSGQAQALPPCHVSTSGRDVDSNSEWMLGPVVGPNGPAFASMGGCPLPFLDRAVAPLRVTRRFSGGWNMSGGSFQHQRVAFCSTAATANAGLSGGSGNGSGSGSGRYEPSSSGHNGDDVHAIVASSVANTGTQGLGNHGFGSNNDIGSSSSSSSSLGGSSSSINSKSDIWVTARGLLPGSRTRRRSRLQALSGSLSPATAAAVAAFSSRAAVRASEAIGALQPPPRPPPPPPSLLPLPPVEAAPSSPVKRRGTPRRVEDPASPADAAASAVSAASGSASTSSQRRPAASPAATIITPKRPRGRPRKAPLPATGPAAAAAAVPLGAAALEPTAATGAGVARATPSPSTLPIIPDLLSTSTNASTTAAAASSSSTASDAAAGLELSTVNSGGVATSISPWRRPSARMAAESPPEAATASAADVAVQDSGYMHLPDTGESYYSSTGYGGDVELWYQQHVEEVLAAPARGPHVPLPSLEQFERQINVEVQARHLALEEYRRELDKQKARGALEESTGVRRLLDCWLPALTAQIENHVNQFMRLEGNWRSRSDLRNKMKVSGSEKARMRTVGVAKAEDVVNKLEKQKQQPQPKPQQQHGPQELHAEGVAGVGNSSSSVAAAADTVTGTGSSSSTAAGRYGGRTLAEAVASPLMSEMREWVPYVLPVPPQVLARTVLSCLLHHTVLKAYDNSLELPTGMTRTVDTAEHIGERLVHTVSYMKVCEAISRRRKELLAEGRKLKAVKGAAGRPPGTAAVAEAVAAVDDGRKGAAATTAADGGGSGGRWNLDSQILEVAVRVRAARKALEGLKAAAAAVQPRSAAMELAGVSAVKGGGGGKSSRARQLKALAEAVPGLSTDMNEWTLEARVRVGASLLALALVSLRIRVPDTGEEEPAFMHTTNGLMTFERGGYQTPGVIVCHPQLLRLLEGDEELRRLLQPRVLPMLVEPRPWHSLRGGGLLTTTVPVVKARDSPLLLTRLREAHLEGRMGQLYDALTVLGNVPWRVNSRVFAVMENFVNSGGGMLGVPSSAPHQLPPRFTTTLNDRMRAYLGDETPEQCGTPYMRLQREGFRGCQLLVGSGALSSGEEAEYQRQCDDVRMANRNESGQRTVLKYRLETARQLVGAYDKYGTGTATPSSSASSPSSQSDELAALMLPTFDLNGSKPTTFFQPHNVDFRGRAYPLHPFLNHLGDDTTRALLQFGVGKPLGERGFQWLLMQVANLWGRGVDKLPMAQRLAWAENMLPAVRASAMAPLESAWWQGGERPWQLLATCFEVAAALEAGGGGNPAGYVSHLPVIQDGTCNGLQHYAALARDRGCGAAVNLLPADRPQDVYQAVADAVADRVARDRKQGRSEATKVYGSVDRKLVKQTVMTYVYGVTIVGAREQIENRLEERGWTNERERRKVASYLARITFESMGEVFGPVVALRAWLDDCAKVAVSSGHPVCWTSPLGFPIEQPYRKLPTVQVWTPLQKITLRDYRRESEAPVDTRRQRNGFPPNYIHSLDSAHMMMTALAVRRAGGVFAAVHDSFWTHAASVDDMSRHIRDKFVELHSRPLLAELRHEVVTNPLYLAARVELPPLPRLGDLQLEAVRESLYFFS